MPEVVDLHVLRHAPTKAGILIVEGLRRRVHVNIGGDGPKHLVDRSEICVGVAQAIPGLRDQSIGRFRRWCPRLPGGCGSSACRCCRFPRNGLCRGTAASGERACRDDSNQSSAPHARLPLSCTADHRRADRDRSILQLSELGKLWPHPKYGLIQADLSTSSRAAGACHKGPIAAAGRAARAA